jgi:hypothetical protein
VHLHIVTFNVPCPADYGGVIDVYYRIVTLAKAGVHIHLHCYTYGRTPAKELEQWCEEVCYYPRETGLRHQFERRPYIVASRCSKALLQRLWQDDYPILLEGLHCCLLLEQLAGQARRIIVRTHNVEHDYYRSLAQSEKSLWRRLFFIGEARKLQRYEPILLKADTVLAISSSDADHFRSLGCADVRLLPPSHGHTEVLSYTGRGDYILYHGNLSVPENIRAAHYLLEEIVERCPYQFVIAGRDPDPYLQQAVSKHPNVRLVANPDDTAMHQLLQQAHVNLLITHQPTGVKLKLMNALYEGRYCLVNSTMIQGTALGEACTIADSSDELLQALDHLMKTDFSEKERQHRIRALKIADPEQDIISILQ